MDASYKIQRGIHVHLIQFFMCPEFWVHITDGQLVFPVFITGIYLLRCAEVLDYLFLGQIPVFPKLAYDVYISFHANTSAPILGYT